MYKSTLRCSDKTKISNLDLPLSALGQSPGEEDVGWLEVPMH